MGPFLISRFGILDGFVDLLPVLYLMIPYAALIAPLDVKEPPLVSETLNQPRLVQVWFSGIHDDFAWWLPAIPLAF